MNKYIDIWKQRSDGRASACVCVCVCVGACVSVYVCVFSVWRRQNHVSNFLSTSEKAMSNMKWIRPKLFALQEIVDIKALSGIWYLVNQLFRDSQNIFLRKIIYAEQKGKAHFWLMMFRILSQAVSKLHSHLFLTALTRTLIRTLKQEK